ncbi:hypothetical protein C8Q74DRAFT_1216935 [Fomes fomentarius]|nr:hypothetical protein C8Q74DRAFT_1216935 [Fomes fomentarius]
MPDSGSYNGRDKFPQHHVVLTMKALQMGPVGFGIYAIREKVSGRVLHAACIPNVRESSTIGHVYLDMASLHRRIFRQLTVAHNSGSETGDMYAAHVALRAHNITIKNLWVPVWWLKTSGNDLQEIILEGKFIGLFNPSDENDVTGTATASEVREEGDALRYNPS